MNVYGDTNSTLAGALAASKLHVPLVHIEAGLRSFDKRMPEEINRVLTDHVSDYLFCPTFTAVNNLRNENIVEGVFHVGDIMFDAVKMFQTKFTLPTNVKINPQKKLAVMTVHRADATSDPLKLNDIVRFCDEFTDQYQIIFPVHPNTRNKIKGYSIDIGGLELIDVVAYLEMQGLLSIAELVLTDSGGLQKEAYFHGCECITLRDHTEWTETIESGWNRLWTHTGDHTQNKILEYGDGTTTNKVVNIIQAA